VFLAGFKVLTAVAIKSSVFWAITLCSPVKVNKCFGGTYPLHLQGWRVRRKTEWSCQQLSACFMLVSCLQYRSKLKTEAEYFFETSVNFHRITRCYASQNQHEADCCLFHAGFLLGLTFDPEDGGDVSSICPLTFTGPHGVISQTTELFVLVSYSNSLDPLRLHVNGDTVSLVYWQTH
jgi:hypothetical protein